MTAYTRAIARQFAPEYQTQFKNLLVAGCSYTWNNSDSTAVAWPYYLRDLANFEQVYDCSQPGSGANLAFAAVINELESNTELTPDNTLVIVMWSDLARVDITAESELVAQWTNVITHQFNLELSSLTVFHTKPPWSKNPAIESLRGQYRRLITDSAQEFESKIKITALKHYLENRGFNYMFTGWEDLAVSDLAQIETLGAYATRNNNRIPNDGHPSPDAHLSWTQKILAPYLVEQKLIKIPVTA